jgi:hypothetical protein
MNNYYKDQELPALAFNWYDSTGALIDFSTGWTFTVKLCASATPNVVAFSKPTGVTGTATLPNVVVDWTTTDFATLTADTTYNVVVYARRTSDSKDRVFNPGASPQITILTAPA